METSNLLEKVLNNLFNESIRNYRSNLNVGENTILVFGYDQPECSYVFMGQFVEGNLYFLTTKNNLILANSSNRSDVGKKDPNEIFADAMVWWRIPTDDEIKLYYRKYENLALMEDLQVIFDDEEYIQTIDNDILDTLKRCYKVLKEN
jgi:hypothetical protein